MFQNNSSSPATGTGIGIGWSISKYPVLRAVTTVCHAILAPVAFFTTTTALGLIVLVALFRFGLFASQHVLFYRGILINVVTALVVLAAATIATRRLGWTPRDAIAAAAVTFCVNLNVLTLGPVTIDRSISVFLLGAMAENPASTHNSKDMDRAFRDIYLTRLDQIDRRMKEQAVTGTVRATPSGYVITPKGLQFVQTARTIADLFNIDTSIVKPGQIQKSQ